jgi:tRNA G18 (ribose-2'-O)-methylase SpoU
MKKETILLLHNIRSAQNVGAMFRTAEAAGISKIYLAGYTPAPLDRFGRDRKDVAKASLGAEKMIPWVETKNTALLIKKLKIAGFYIVAIEQSEKSIDYKKLKLKLKQKTAFIVGNEVDGLSPAILKNCHVVAEIPMHRKLARNRLPGEGGKESLNVSVALGVALFRICDL